MTTFDLAQRYVGIREIAGEKDHPLIQWWLSLCQGFDGETHDEVPWCSAFANGMAWEMRRPRSKRANARSWLLVGRVVACTPIDPPQIGEDVVILKRGTGEQPGPEVTNAPGHVGFYAGHEGDQIIVLGGNQGDAVSLARFPAARVLGVRRLV